MLQFVKSSFKHRSTQTLLALALYLLFAKVMPLSLHEGLYTLSILIKDVLLWTMPLTVFFFIAYTIQGFERKAPLFILVLVVFEAVSNMSSVWYAYGSANLVANQLPSLAATKIADQLAPLWRLPISKPTWWSAQYGVMAGILIGFVVGFKKIKSVTNIIVSGKQTMQWLLTKVFARLIPIFVLGFAAQIYQTKLISQVFAYYSQLIIWLLLFLALYLVLLFMLGAGRSLTLLLSNIKKLLPAGAIALTSSCSLSTMPWTIEGAAKTLKNPELANAIIPATTNIQQIGDCIANTFLCFLIFRHFYGFNPDLTLWLNFSLVFVMARFATSAVLGGAIFIMLPIYETYLNFNGEMIAIILALNVVLDPLITSANVLANGALCRVFEKVWMRIPSIFTVTGPRRDLVVLDTIGDQTGDK